MLLYKRRKAPDHEENIKKWGKPVLFTAGGALVGLAYYYFIKCPSGSRQSETPDLDAAYAKLGEDIHFLMVNMTTSSRESVATAFIDEQGYSFPVFYDTDGVAAEAYSLPTTYFIDADGYGVAQVTGAINRETLEKGIGMITEQGYGQRSFPYHNRKTTKCGGHKIWSQ